LAHEQVTNEEAKERRTVLAEAAVLKKYAVYHSNVSFEIDRSSWGIHWQRPCCHALCWVLLKRSQWHYPLDVYRLSTIAVIRNNCM